LGIELNQKSYYYTRHRLTYNTDQSKKYSAKGSFEFGDYYNGNLKTTTLGIRIAPIPHAALTVDYEYNDFKKVGELNSNLETHLVTGGLRLAYDANIQANTESLTEV